MEKKSVYSICKIVLPVPISCSYPTQTRIKYGAWPYSDTRENSGWYFGLKHLTFSLQANTYHIAFLLRILSNHMLPWINSTTSLLKNQNQFDLGTFPFPNEIETQYLTFLGVCR